MLSIESKRDTIEENIPAQCPVQIRTVVALRKQFRSVRNRSADESPFPTPKALAADRDSANGDFVQNVFFCHGRVRNISRLFIKYREKSSPTPNITARLTHTSETPPGSSCAERRLAEFYIPRRGIK